MLHDGVIIITASVLFHKVYLSLYESMEIVNCVFDKRHLVYR